MAKWTLSELKRGHEAITRFIWPAIKTQLELGKAVEVEVTGASKTRDQEKHYHWIIGHIAKQARHMGAKWGALDWKRLLLDEFAKDSGMPRGKIIPSLSGDGVVEVGILSRKFNRQQGSDFIEFLLGWGAINGVAFPAYTPDIPDLVVDKETGEIL